MASLIRARGLGTYNNELGLPEGSLIVADNVVIDRDDIITPRRGLANYGTELPCCLTACQIFEYKDKLLLHDGTKLYFDNACNTGSFTAFNGTYLPLESGIRIKSVESNGNLYITTNDGIKKISGTKTNGSNNFTSAANFITNAGGPKALDTTGTITYECGGFLAPLSKTAYRVVWGLKDNNKNLILGSPSSRFVISNTDCTTFANVCVTFTVPSEVTSSNYFYQIYRTGIVTACCASGVPCLNPGDEMNLVYEAATTTANITAGIITIKDSTPDCFRESGVLLYTNPVSGGGILQANEKPPVAKDIALFRNSVFFANTSTLQRQQFNVLSVGSLTSGQSKFVIANACVAREYTFRGTKESYTIATVADVTNSLNGKYVLLNSASNEKKYVFWFESIACTVEPCAVDTCGKIIVKVPIVACDTAPSIATKLQTKIAAQCVDFLATVCCSTITVTNTKNGNAIDASNGLTSPAFTFCVTTQGLGECATCNFVLLSSLVSPAQSIDESSRSLVNIINRDDCSPVSAFYLSGEDDLPGIILLESKNLSDSEFYVAVQDDCTNITAQFSPTMDNSISISSMAGICTCTKTRVTTSVAHTFIACDSVYIYNTCNSTSGNYTVLAVCACANTFDITQAFTGTSTGRVFEINQISDNETKPNRIYFSKTGIPEAVPLVNYLDVGGQDEAIERIVALRDNLFVLKEDGVYILTGDAGNFSVRLLDNSTYILAPDSAAVLNNQIYMLSSQGVATISDTGIGVVSRPIEDKILEVANARFNFRTATFGVGYESDRSYILWLPSETSDTVATQSYRFNTFNRSWVRWTVNARSGLVKSLDGKLYISSGDSSYIRQERKNNDRTDFADRDYGLCISAQPICLTTPSVELSNICGVVVGDALVQTQYVTVAKYNRLLKKLDLDTGFDNDYFCALEMSPGACSAQYLIDLRTKLNTNDCSVCYTVPTCAPSSSNQIRLDFNTLVGQINCCSTVSQFNDYSIIGANCSVEYEALVIGKCAQFSSVNISAPVPFVGGIIRQFNGINSVVIWAPQHFGDPSTLKQISEGTVVFDGNNFYNAKVAYSTDLSKSFDERTFVGQGVGYWGGFVWGEAAWGGEGTDSPYRTLIPRQKQRCRYITVRFTHVNAREDFTILGISLDARQLSTRAYRGI